MDKELWEKLEEISEKEERELFLESMSDEEFQKFYDKYFTPYKDVFERLA